jgi:hypothetical protein
MDLPPKPLATTTIHSKPQSNTNSKGRRQSRTRIEMSMPKAPLNINKHQKRNKTIQFFEQTKGESKREEKNEEKVKLRQNASKRVKTSKIRHVKTRHHVFDVLVGLSFANCTSGLEKNPLFHKTTDKTFSTIHTGELQWPKFKTQTTYQPFTIGYRPLCPYKHFPYHICRVVMSQSNSKTDLKYVKYTSIIEY